jgi:hypothetical protein
VLSLRKTPMQLRLANLCVNGNKFDYSCTDFCAVTKQCETTQNISFLSNGLDRVRSLQKILTQFRLANLCVNGTSSAYFGPTFV